MMTVSEVRRRRARSGAIYYSVRFTDPAKYKAQRMYYRDGVLVPVNGAHRGALWVRQANEIYRAGRVIDEVERPLAKEKHVMRDALGHEFYHGKRCR